MNCPFCKSPARTDWGYHCGTSQDATPQRTNRCREAEVSILKERINQLEGLLAEEKWIGQNANALDQMIRMGLIHD